jgi:hypothetical protein
MRTDRGAELSSFFWVLQKISNTRMYLGRGSSCCNASIYLCRNMAAVALLIAAISLAGCTTTARINQFKDFSTVGVAYTKALDPLLDSAGEAAIDANSLVLEKAFPTLKKEDAVTRATELDKHNNLLRERLAVLNDIKLHAHLLRSYFQALGSLAESDAAEGIGTGASEIVNQLGKISPKIEAAKIGTASVADFVGPVVKIAVKNFQMAALDRELAARSAVIERELELQSAALQAITRIMRADLKYQSNMKMYKEVYAPYSKDASLPKDWIKKRKVNLTSEVSVSAADAAAKAAKDLKRAFISLVEGGFTSSDIPAIINDINAILDMVELAKKGSK